MESYRPVSAPRKHGGEMYSSRSSYTKSKELPVNSDEENLHDSLSDEGIFVMRYRPICAIDRSRCAIGGSLVSAAIERSRNDRSIAQQSTNLCAIDGSSPSAGGLRDLAKSDCIGLDYHQKYTIALFCYSEIIMTNRL